MTKPKPKTIIVQGTAPPRGLPIWEFYCPACNRHGEMAFEYVLTGKPVPRDELAKTVRCPGCSGEVEVLGRVDQ